MVENRALRGPWGPQQNENLQLFFNSPLFFPQGRSFQWKISRAKEKGPPRGLILGRFPRE